VEGIVMELKNEVNAEFFIEIDSHYSD